MEHNIGPMHRTFQIFVASVGLCGRGFQFCYQILKGQNYTQRKSGSGQNLGFPFNISAMIEDSDFKIAKLMGFAKAHQKFPPRRKRGCGIKLGELPEIWRFSFNIYAMAESFDFKFGT